MRGLFIGHPSGSAMPLVWAHAEYIKLCRSLLDGEILDRPPQTVPRYLKEKVISGHIIWRFNNKLRAMPAGRTLRVETLARSGSMGRNELLGRLSRLMALERSTRVAPEEW